MSNILHQQDLRRPKFTPKNTKQKLHLNCGKMTYLIKYTLTVEFSIQDYTRQLHNNNLLNMKSKNKLLLPFYQKKIRKIWTKMSTTKHSMFRATNLR